MGKTVKNYIFALMKTTKNERLGLIALTLILAAIVAIAVCDMRTADTATVPVEVIEGRAPSTSAASDTIIIKDKKNAPSPKKGRKSVTPRPDMRRDPFEHRVTPQ